MAVAVAGRPRRAGLANRPGCAEPLARGLGDRRRQLAEQTLELRGLRGKSGAKLRLMLERVDAEAAEFEQCTARLHAMRSVHARMLKDALRGLCAECTRDIVAALPAAFAKTLLGLGARRAFVQLCGVLRGSLDAIKSPTAAESTA